MDTDFYQIQKPTLSKLINKFWHRISVGGKNLFKFKENFSILLFNRMKINKPWFFNWQVKMICEGKWGRKNKCSFPRWSGFCYQVYLYHIFRNRVFFYPIHILNDILMCEVLKGQEGCREVCWNRETL